MITVFWFFLLGVILSEYVQLISDRGTFLGSLFGRSRCDHCKTEIPWWALIPILGRLLTKKRCFYCEKKIKTQYMWFEIEFSIGWGLVLMYAYSVGLTSVAFLGLTLLLYCITALLMYEDYKQFSVPVSWLLSWMVLYSLMWFVYIKGQLHLLDAGIMFVVLIFSLMFVLLRKRLKISKVGDLFGAADVLVLLLFALLLGFQKTTWVLIFSMIGAILYLVLEKKLTKGQRIPLLTVMLPWGFMALLFM